MTEVSVIIPCYNSSEFIESTINSLLKQTFKDCEYIFIDDGSSDKTSEIISSYQSADSRIVLVKKENGGVSSTRNKGLSLAKGRYILFCDSDDILFDDSIELMLKNIKQFEADVCFGTYITFEKDFSAHIERKSFKTLKLNKYSMQKELSLCKKIQNHLWGKMFKASVLKKYTFNESYRVWEDIRELYRILDLCDSGVFLNTDFVMYRLSLNSLSKQINYSVLNEFCKAQIDKANFYLTKYPKLAKYHAESMFQCGAEVLSRKAADNIPLFRLFMDVYRKVIKKASLKQKIKYFLINHKSISKLIFK